MATIINCISCGRDIANGGVWVACATETGFCRDCCVHGHSVPAPVADVHEIHAAVERAIRYHAPLVVEFDSGVMTLEGDELRQAWDDLTLDDPFTIHSGMPRLLSKIEADFPEEEPTIFIPLGQRPDADDLDAYVVSETARIKYHLHTA
ncbi:hypothetical protein [Microbacterium aurantiacum]|uniref:hypothetical protein n=1 Tax=Microbacterium aurantiacum TaxID=162393 RepID=UPI000C808579|nr:hypothetical protein [Microbacterium aurantiacum]